MTTTTRRAAAGALAIAMLAAGCGRGTGTAQERARDVTTANATGEVTVWAMGEEGKALGAFVKGFESAHPGVKVNVTAIGWDVAHDKITSAIAGGATPDVSMIGSTWSGELAKTGALEPTPGNLVDKAAFFPGAWQTVDINGTAYGVPWYVETRVLYYRTDQARRAGVQPPRTWEEFTAFVRALKDKGGARRGFNQSYQLGASWQEVLPLIWQAGGEIVKDGKYTFDTPEAVTALKQYASLFQQKLAPTDTPANAFPQTFIKGEVGAFYSGPWMIGVLNDDGGPGFAGKFGVAPYPKGPVSATSFVGGADLAVFKKAKNRDAAWALIKWLSEPKVQAQWYTTVKALPAVQAAWQEPELKADEQLAVFGEQLKDARTPPPFPTWEQVARVLEAELEKLARGRSTPERTAKAIQAQADTIGTGL
ncbi:N-Acetyl-D-glucosamine ABC transport system, sugar-binding protein [[Actinomadura] parvosata subsp. kistnae]|uniref:ABC transporter substrate-binding protein n=1 Tax=[Actinomadura] parvosata subsp. kistnae TaxID=1909395 RepID=A0A1U9ZS12_9ACTN|nr:sugar ABC transporter substrate-binding protein [Nonomuraea sp. ATCC 55076]AQZ60735.1 ABC transporter substrate-binding protein [Nonomuraea sp. ATCC 55076]SPL90650.1 N-Acetyl-D-glucosamine ABC transport system, sugar-binding protein [Actinomadura parvosata subsp. kistnae]